MALPTDPVQIEYIVYGAIATVIFGGLTIYGALFKKARADKADRTELYKYINEGNDHTANELKDLQDKYADVREQLGFLKGVLSVKK